MMSAFFKQSKKADAASTPTKRGGARMCLHDVVFDLEELTLRSSSLVASETDFQRAFKPFLVRKDVILAPPNLFICKGKGKEHERAEIIVLDDDGDIEMTAFRTPVSSPTKVGREGISSPAALEFEDSAMTAKGELNTSGNLP